MLKKIFATLIGVMLVGILGFALRLWIIGESVKQINTTILDSTTKTMDRLKNTTNQISLPTNPIQSSSDQQHPKANLQDWDSISNKQQICWIHKKTHRKVCEQKP